MYNGEGGGGGGELCVLDVVQGTPVNQVRRGIISIKLVCQLEE